MFLLLTLISHWQCFSSHILLQILYLSLFFLTNLLFNNFQIFFWFLKWVFQIKSRLKILSLFSFLAKLITDLVILSTRKKYKKIFWKSSQWVYVKDKKKKICFRIIIQFVCFFLSDNDNAKLFFFFFTNESIYFKIVYVCYIVFARLWCTCVDMIPLNPPPDLSESRCTISPFQLRRKIPHDRKKHVMMNIRTWI